MEQQHSFSAAVFSNPAANLSMSTLDKHLAGDVNFEQTFVKAPALINSGLGPLFNNVLCINCHIADGRGRPPLGSEALETMLIRISIDGIEQTAVLIRFQDLEDSFRINPSSAMNRKAMLLLAIQNWKIILTAFYFTKTNLSVSWSNSIGS
ncbi:MAG: hypothetical protein MZV64_24690 [Ignavibacteriales bacterium]|nr:hypothetical protein [Ignavibacteriales bacterium]